ncbi:MAG: SurA N-terminal domain-containing protein [Verrucomicrobiaceae bacterium]|nr:SurA N-terminal domain-containing protein [Verrucomicrobiaceae bacterium]
MNALDSLFSWTLAASLRATFLALAVLALQAALRGRLTARGRYALWLPVLFVLVMPVLPESRWSAEHVFATETPALAMSALDDIPLLDVAPVTAVNMSPVSESLSSVSPAPIDWHRVIVVTWFVGVLASIVGGAGFYLAMMRRIRLAAVPASVSLTASVQSLASSIKLRRAPIVRVSAAVESPAVTGLWRPMLLLPADFEHAFAPKEADLVLKHELTHLKRADLLMNALLCVLQTLHWFNPLLWFAGARVRQDRESACDAQVLASDERDCRSDYGHALLKVQSAYCPRGFSLGFVGIFGGHAAIRSRITAIACYQRSHPLKGLLAGSLIACLAALGATRAEPPGFEVGAAQFAPGDVIHITSVNRSEAIIAVSGDYELASQDEATLAFHITARDSEHAMTKTDPQQRISVKKGKGTFTLVHPHPYPGMPHVSFYPGKGGQVLGGIYFGTKEEVQAAIRMVKGSSKPSAKTTGDASAPDKSAAKQPSDTTMTGMKDRWTAYKALLAEIQKLQKESQDQTLSAESRAKAAAAFTSKTKEAHGIEKEMNELQQRRTEELKQEKGKSAAVAPAASVNGKVILSSELDNAISAQRQIIALQHRDDPKAADEALAKLRTTALDSLIDRELMLAEFKKAGGNIKAEFVDADIDKLIQEQFKGDREKFIAELAKSGMTMKKFRELREKMIIVQVMRSRQSGKPMTPSGAEIDAYVQSHRAAWHDKDKVTLSTLTIPKSTSDARVLADDLRAQLAAGADFATLARKHSQDSRASQGGEWPEMEIKALSPTLRTAASTTKVGELSAVIDDTAAFIILKVNSRQPSDDALANEADRVEAVKRLQAEQGMAKVNEWLAGLRKKARIQTF